RFDNDLANRINLGAGQVFAAKGTFVPPIVGFEHFKRTVFAHVSERVETLCLGGFRQTGHALEDKAVILVDRDLLAWTIRAFEVLADALLTSWVDLPTELDPEFVLFPHAAGVRFIGELYRLAVAFPRDTQNRLAESNPGGAVRFVAVEIVALGTVTHW